MSLVELLLLLPALLLPLAVVLALVFLIRTPGKRRWRFAAALLTLIVPGLLLVGDRYVLRRLGLALRSWAVGCLWMAVTAGSILLLVCVARYLSEGEKGWMRIVSTPLALLGCFSILWWSLFFFAFTINSERVVEHGGCQYVEVDNSFLDKIYDYYDYHGFLLRGSKRQKSWSNGSWWGEPWEDVRPQES